MSQVASAYVLLIERIQSLSQSATKKDWKELWTELKQEREVTPAYGYSGHVVDVLLAYWEERDVQIPLMIGEPPFSAIGASDLGLQICADHKSARKALDALATLPLDESDLRQYFNAFTCSDWDEAGRAMKEGWIFVVRGFELVKDETECYLLFVG